MTRNIFDYFERRAVEEEQLAASAHHPMVKETHAKFAAAYRERILLEFGNVASLPVIATTQPAAAELARPVLDA